MNEFVGKKLGEVLAFARVGAETIQHGKEALTNTLGEDKVLDMVEHIAMHTEALTKVASDGGVIDTTLTKADATEKKLRAMRDLYVADQWDNATELMEWSGFFEGAAIVHWALIKGCAEGLNDEGLLALADECIMWHTKLLELSKQELSQVGADRSQ